MSENSVIPLKKKISKINGKDWPGIMRTEQTVNREQNEVCKNRERRKFDNAV
jgi:hypothetical protein